MKIRMSNGAKLAMYIFLGIMVFITLVPLLYVASVKCLENRGYNSA